MAIKLMDHLVTCLPTKLLHDPDVPRGCDPNSPEYVAVELGDSDSF